jgi:ABC-type branched-subunit amino acid transport system ATPase component
MLEASGLSKHFNGVQAVADVSFRIDKGTITSLIGPNGAGKTTLFNIICGYTDPEKGYTAICGEKLNGSAPYARASQGIGRTFQNLRIIGKVSVLDNVMLAFGNHMKGGFLKALIHSISSKEEQKNRTKAFEHLEFVGLAEKADEPAESLSYGQQKLLSLACCLALDAKLLMLDEPVAGVNQETISRILELLEQLRSKGLTVLLIEHNIDAVMKVSDRLIVMDEGRIIADGEPSKVKENPAVIDAYLS